MKKIIVCFISASVFLYSGCQYGGLMSIIGTPGHYEKTIPAEYDLNQHADKKILVLVNQPNWLDIQANLRFSLTEAISKNLREGVEFPEGNIVSYDELSEFRSGKSNFSLLLPAEVGEALNADLVLLVALESCRFDVMGESGYYRGALNAQVVLIDVPSGDKVWPESANSKAIKVGFEIEDRKREVAAARLVAALAYCTTRYLYDCPKAKFRIADDRSSIGWESWD